jgi:hypothetical protein
MTNYFNINFSDLSFTKQEEVRDFVRTGLKEDSEAMEEIKERAKEEEKEYGGSLLLKDRIDLLLDEEVEDEAEKRFCAKGEV